MNACAKYSDLSQVRREFNVSYDFIYSSFYERLELKLKERSSEQWPTAIGIDEHRYGKRKNGYGTQFVSILVNQNTGRMFEVVQGRTKEELYAALFEVEGRERVNWVTMDLSETYRSFISEHFPNAKIVADKFHVIRLLSPHILKERRAVAGTKAQARARRLLLVSSQKLGFFERKTIRDYLKNHPKLEELYLWKERLHQFYRSRSYYVAWRSLKKMLDEMSVSFLPEIQTLRRTLIRWQEQCLNYFLCRLTNGPLEGFNNKASVLKRRAYGYRNPNNYRLQLLNACS
jgi:transposase